MYPHWHASFIRVIFSLFQAIDEKIRELSNCHIVYEGIDFQKVSLSSHPFNPSSPIPQYQRGCVEPLHVQSWIYNSLIILLTWKLFSYFFYIVTTTSNETLFFLFYILNRKKLAFQKRCWKLKIFLVSVSKTLLLFFAVSTLF